MATTLSDQITIPEHDRGTSIKDSEGRVLAQLIQEGGYSRTLEVGMAYGLSTAYIMTAHRGDHEAIDPYQRTGYDDLGVKNALKLGLSERLTLHRDSSHNVLPRLLAEQRTFDFILIDGGHRYDQIFTDCFYADLLLEQQGMIVFHDTWMRGTQLVLSFMKKNRPDYEVVKTPVRNLGVMRKVGEDERTWNHFKEFYSWRSLLRHGWFNVSHRMGRKR
jgi:predicted O-methyltransferase YrrM